MNNSFNRSRYCKLMEKETAFNNQGTSLLYENQSEFLELLGYQVSVEQQIMYNRKNDYFCFIELYINKLMTTFEFQSEFLKMEKKDAEESAKILEDYTQLSAFSMVSNLKEFSNLTDQISELCFEVNEVRGLSEEKFYSSVENLYVQLQECFDDCFYTYKYTYSYE